MMTESSARHIFVTAAFRRAAKRTAKQNPEFAQRIREVIELLEANMFAPSLRTHKLKGSLENCWACSVTFSLRIVFEVGPPVEINGFKSEAIVLLTVGTHDEVY